MKEKMKKMFQYICTWKFVMWPLNRYKTRYGELPPDAPSVQPQSEAPSTVDTPEEPIAEPAPEPSAVSKKPRNINRRPRTTPKKPRTKKNKEEQA